MTVILINDEPEGLVKAVADSKKRFNKMIMDELSSSSTARLIVGVLDDSPLKVGVLIFDAEFDSMYQPPSILEGKTKDYDGGVALVRADSPMKLKGVTLPMGISLIHELGHAKQFVERPIWFEALFRKIVQANFSGTRTTLPEKYEIEDQNVTYHEKPVCKELGFPFRDKYD